MLPPKYITYKSFRIINFKHIFRITDIFSAMILRYKTYFSLMIIVYFNIRVVTDFYKNNEVMLMGRLHTFCTHPLLICYDFVLLLFNIIWYNRTTLYSAFVYCRIWCIVGIIMFPAILGILFKNPVLSN